MCVLVSQLQAEPAGFGRLRQRFAVTIAGIELMQRIRKEQFGLRRPGIIALRRLRWLCCQSAAWRATLTPEVGVRSQALIFGRGSGCRGTDDDLRVFVSFEVRRFRCLALMERAISGCRNEFSDDRDSSARG